MISEHNVWVAEHAGTAIRYPLSGTAIRHRYPAPLSGTAIRHRYPARYPLSGTAIRACGAAILILFSSEALALIGYSFICRDDCIFVGGSLWPLSGP